MVIAGIVLLSLLSWAYLLGVAMPGQAGTLPKHASMHSAMAAWDGGLLLISIVMCSVMMIAMM